MEIKAERRYIKIISALALHRIVRDGFSVKQVAPSMQPRTNVKICLTD
jgi:hypothetical protein